MRQGKDAQTAGLDGVRTPPHEVAIGATSREPVGQGVQVCRPLVAPGVGHDDVAEHPVQLAAQAADERRLAPARLQLPAHRDRRAAGKDVGVRALQAEEGDLEPQPQQPAGCAEVVVGGGGQQVHVGGVAVQQGLNVAVETAAVDAEAQADSRDEVLSRREQFGDRQGGEAGVGGRERSASLNLGGHRVNASGRAFILEGTLADVLAKRQAQRACFGIR
jgi:hypothetical protein